jgi:hypothetical protein
MVEPDHDRHEPEQLTGGDGPRVRWTAAVAVAVLVAGAVLLARAGHHPVRPSAAHHHVALPPAPAPTATATTPAVHVGSVFLEHLLQCTHTDHHHRLSVALGVTNLGGRSLLLVSAVGVSSDIVLVQPTSVRVGTQPCGAAPARGPVRLGPGADAVITLAFRIGAACPRHALVSARVSFDGGSAGIVHADSAQLANLGRLDFVQCGPTA